MDSLNLGEILLLHRQSRNILELDTLGSEPRTRRRLARERKRCVSSSFEYGSRKKIVGE